MGLPREAQGRVVFGVPSMGSRFVHEEISGVLEHHAKGHGYIRLLRPGLETSPRDPMVTRRVIDQFHLRAGVFLEGECIPVKDRGFQGLQLARLFTVNGLHPHDWLKRPDITSLTPINPNRQFKLEHPGCSVSMRVLDMVCPLGKGQRGLIVASPRSGKTILMQEIAGAIAHNDPDTKIIVLLIDERPEEVTDMRRSIKGDVFASSNDQTLESHLRLAQIGLEYARRWTEAGRDVIVLLDSLTRLGRAFNAGQRGSGRTMSGGMDARALEIPRRIFGAARNLEEGGSLTILATALVETNSRMDDLIFEEFKGTGNMEIVLSRKLAEKRIWPAIDILASGTRREELLLGNRIEGHRAIRRFLADNSPEDAMRILLRGMEKAPTNDELLSMLHRD